MVTFCFQRCVFPSFFAFLLCVCLPHSGWAQSKVKTLTDANVKAFIEETTDISKINSNNLSPKKISKYLDRHIEDQARFKSILRYHLPELPVQEARVSLSKEEFMDSVGQGAEKVEDYENLIQITEIKIASDGKKAFVKTESTEFAALPVPTETGGSEEVPIEGVSECNQILSLNKGIIQMYSANCVTNINFLEY